MRRRPPKSICGKVFSGLGQGAYFTQLDWVREQCAAKLGFAPYPGTLNLRVANEELEALRRLRGGPRVVLEPPDARFCQGVCYPILMGDVAAAIVVPLVEDYPKDIVEIIAPVNIKETLGIGDGDMLEIKPHQPACP